MEGFYFIKYDGGYKSKTWGRKINKWASVGNIIALLVIGTLQIKGCGGFFSCTSGAKDTVNTQSLSANKDSSKKLLPIDSLQFLLHSPDTAKTTSLAPDLQTDTHSKVGAKK